MEANTYFGDYPHYAPEVPEKAGEFAGWMLLSYNKPSKASSQEEGHGPGLVVDENVKTFWLAKNNGVGEWLQIDLQKPAMVYAIQVNYNDYQSDMYGRIPGLKHRYLIKGSLDGQNWQVLVDRSDNYRDVPNDYVELGNPRRVRYLRYENILVPTPYLSISALRVFGKGEGRTPAKVKAFKVNRKTDRRNALITWEPRDNTQGYNVLWGIAPGELHHSWMVYGDNELLLKSLTVDQDYYFAIEAFNEKGISQRSEEVYVK